MTRLDEWPAAGEIRGLDARALARAPETCKLRVTHLYRAPGSGIGDRHPSARMTSLSFRFLTQACVSAHKSCYLTPQLGGSEADQSDFASLYGGKRPIGSARRTYRRLENRPLCLPSALG